MKNVPKRSAGFVLKRLDPAHPDFADAALEAVRQWKFSPTLLNGKPVEVLMGVTINFSLEE